MKKLNNPALAAGLLVAAVILLVVMYRLAFHQDVNYPTGPVKTPDISSLVGSSGQGGSNGANSPTRQGD